MKTNTTKTTAAGKALKITSVVIMAISAVLLCIVLSEIFRGSLSTLEASKVTYFSEDAAAVAHVRDFEVIHTLGLCVSLAAMFAAGFFGYKHAAKSEKIGLCLTLAAGSIACWIGSLVFYDTAYSALYNTYDIYPTSGVSIIAPIVAVLTVFIVMTLVNRNAPRKNVAQIEEVLQ